MAENKFLEVDRDSFPYIFLKNVDIPLKTHEKGTLRCNVFLPKDAVPYGSKKYPVVATYGPYGKDVPYGVFYKKSWEQVNPEMKSAHSAWETPDPAFWTSKGYIVVRTDERGAGQSPGLLDTMSRGTSEAFFDVIEWAAEQEWSSGKVGLLGISYYAGTQWRVAARKPKGLAAIIPWEGMSDYYRDRVRHGGILSDRFIKFWWTNGVGPNQYGKPGRAARKWGEDTLEGDLDEKVLFKNRRDQTLDTAVHKFRDEDYYKTRDFDVGAIETPLLSVANWGGILLHLRGNVLGWMRASSKYKFLHFIVGRHDLPFYYPESAELQLSFFNAFLKDNDEDGWKIGKQPRVRLCLRKGEAGVDDPERERGFPQRDELDWPLPGTEYTKFFLVPDSRLDTKPSAKLGSIDYDALKSEPLTFKYTTPSSLEITGHIVAHLTVSASRKSSNSLAPSDIDLFVTLRKLNSEGKEVFYTGTMGDPVPIVKGWLRVSLRKVDADNEFHKDFLPYRNYYSSEVQPVEENQKYEVDVEIWPTNVVLEPQETLVLEVAGHDTQGVGNFSHEQDDDRNPKVFDGKNTLHVLRKAKLALFGPLSHIPGPVTARWTNLILKYYTLAGRRMQYLDSLFIDYGPVVRVSPNEVGINNPDDVKVIQKVSGGFSKSAWYDMTGPGMLGMRDRERHSRRRRLLAHPLSNSSLLSFEPLIRAKVDLAMDQMQKEGQKLGYADVHKWFSFMATDIIGDLTFGSSFRMLEQGKRSQYVEDLQSAMSTVHKRIEYSPFFDLLFLLPIPQIKEFMARFDRITNYGKESIRRLQLAQQAGSLNTPIFFDKIMNPKDKEHALTELEMQEEAAEFMVTGTDTTSNTLTYLVWSVLKDAAIRDRIEGEVATLPPDFTDLHVSKLPYLNCVVQEALRMYGAASGSHSRDVPEGGWEVGGYYVPDTATVLTQAYSLHRLREVFPNPEKFNPDRWLNPTAEMQGAFIPFGGGPRICIGIHLAYMELRLTSAAFFSKFHGATVHPSLLEDDMTLENYTLIVPKSRKCLIKL
ncbi:cytochrome P450 [Ilyonectria sp. MPI-CAGE-AT-0026]|nr:cytochrome P450 [Ilyonectria sp. MPI-CAGE-AT-0026]